MAVVGWRGQQEVPLIMTMVPRSISRVMSGPASLPPDPPRRPLTPPRPLRSPVCRLVAVPRRGVTLRGEQVDGIANVWDKVEVGRKSGLTKLWSTGLPDELCPELISICIC